MSHHRAFRQAVETTDLDSIVGMFADGAVLHSPISFKPFVGRDAIRVLLSVLLEVFEDFYYTDELTSPDGTAALIFRTRVGDRAVQGLDLLRFDGVGQIVELTVMVRPRSASEALLAAVGPRLAAASPPADQATQ